jgi:methyl-accepting chemotaxis protein
MADELKGPQAQRDSPVTTEPTPDPVRRTRTIPPDIKVLAAVGSLVVLLVLAIALAIAFIITLGNSASIAERQARYSGAVDAAALYAKAMANDERGFLISGSQEFLAQMETRTELARAAFDTAAAAADSSQRATIEEAREGFERWLDTLDRELATYQAGGEEAAIEMSLGTSRTQRHAYEGWLSDAKSLGVAAFQDAAGSVSTASSVSVMVLLIYLVVSVALAVAISLWVLRTVLRPAYELVRMLRDAQDDAKPTAV